MIIYFAATIQQLRDADQEILAEVLSRLSSANAEGKHLVCFPPSVRGWLSAEGASLDLRKKDRARIDAIASEYPSRYSLFKQANVNLTITNSLVGLTEESSGRYVIGYASFLNGRWYSEPNLLVENIDLDGEFYSHVLQEMRRKKRLPNINFRLAHGGGTSIEHVFNHALSRREIAVAIIDGDRKSPNSECSITEKRLRKTKETLSSGISEVMTLPCRDIENLVPPSLLRECNVCPQYSVDNFAKLERLYQTGFPDNCESIPYAFFDVKLGTHRSKVAGMTNSSERRWVEENILSIDGNHFDSLHGFGENLLSVILQRGDVIERFISYMSSDYWCAVFDDFFERIIYFLVSDKKMVTR